MEEDLDIPPFFLCPISLQLMTDPVTLSTGITYDRQSIEKWLFSVKNTTCPVTNSPLPDSNQLTPNHTLRRLIQSWCTLKSSHGVHRIPTPKPPVTTTQILNLLHDPELCRKKCLRRLRSLASHSESNKRSMEAAGAVEFLAGVVAGELNSDSELYIFEPTDCITDALSVLHNLNISETGLKHLLRNNNSAFVRSLTKILQNGNYSSRAYAIMLLKSMYEAASADQTHFIATPTELFTETIQVVKDQISPKATKAALKLLITLCRAGRSRAKAVGAGGVRVVIELLLDLGAAEKRACEMALVALDMLCGCAEGRAELLEHAGGLAAVAERIMRVSAVGSERAVGILHSVAKFSGSERVVREMVEMGVVGKVWMWVEGGGVGNRAKQKAREILKLLCGQGRNSQCLAASLRYSYPY